MKTARGASEIVEIDRRVSEVVRIRWAVDAVQ